MMILFNCVCTVLKIKISAQPLKVFILILSNVIKLSKVLWVNTLNKISSKHSWCIINLKSFNFCVIYIVLQVNKFETKCLILHHCSKFLIQFKFNLPKKYNLHQYRENCQLTSDHWVTGSGASQLTGKLVRDRKWHFTRIWLRWMKPLNKSLI